MQAPLPYDVRGLDTEDIHIIPGTPYCLIVSEESPSASLVNCQFGKSACGTIVARFVPKGLGSSLAGGKQGVGLSAACECAFLCFPCLVAGVNRPISAMRPAT